MSVERAGGKYCFLVKSRSRKGSHAVDLSQNRVGTLYLGACTCEHFRLTLYQAFKTDPEVDPKYWCYHLTQAWLYQMGELTHCLILEENALPTTGRKMSKADIERARKSYL